MQGDLQAAFHGLGPAGDKNHFGQGAATIGPDDRSQVFEGRSGKVVAVAMRDVGHLGHDGGVDLGIGMAEAIDGGATGAVDILLAAGIPKIAALGMGDAGQGGD